MDRRVGCLGTVLLVVLAGCQAPMAQPSQEISIAVEDGNLSVSPEQVFVDVRSVMEVEATPPERVTVLDNASLLESDASDLPRLYHLVGLTDRRGLNGTAFERMENGATSASGFIFVIPSPGGDPAGTEWVLAHEFGHYLNLKLGRVSTLAGNVSRTVDGRYVRQAVREGATVFATDAYLSRHGKTRTDPTAPMYERLMDAVPPGEIKRYGFSRYVFGHRYVAARVDDPADLGAVFERPPTTSEQIIHGIPPGREPPATLNATVAGSESWSVGGTNRMGEAFIRYALENGVDSSRARRAAAGWGVDRLYYLRPDGGGQTSYAWVFRWDDRSNATEFERALRTYLDNRGTRQDAHWDLSNATAAIRTPTERSTVLLLGNRTVTTATTVEGTAGDVRIAPP